MQFFSLNILLDSFLKPSIELYSYLRVCVDLKTVTLDASDEKCPKSNQVCCKNPDLEIELCPHPPTPPPPTELPKTKGGSNPPTPPPPPKDPWAACGRSLDSKVTISNLGRGEDLASGVDSQPGEFPHMCVIYKRLSTGELTYVGGGSLIARNKILTVAHKFYV